MHTTAAILILLSYTVTDGDTLRADDLRLRIWGIDAPEMNTTAGVAARIVMQQLTRHQRLTCEYKDVDRYRRVVARCTLPDGRDLACAMVSMGAARDWPRYSDGAYTAC